MPTTADMRRIVLLNPNTDARVTAAMVAVARTAAPDDDVVVDGVTAPFGVTLITTPEALATAAKAVVAAGRALPADGHDGVIVSAFGDPGLARLRALLHVPAVGIAEAGMAAAARHGRFSVVTTTPALAGSIAALAASYGHADRLVSIRVTDADPSTLMGDSDRLLAALAATCRTAVERDHAACVLIGGGPLATAARALKGTLPVPVIEPIPCAVERLLTIPPASGR
jgi:Asp/Glu/hydantoin racemase